MDWATYRTYPSAGLGNLEYNFFPVQVLGTKNLFPVLVWGTYRTYPCTGLGNQEPFLSIGLESL